MGSNQSTIKEEFENVKTELIKQLLSDNAKLKKEKEVLLAVASGNHNWGDEFKDICRENFTAEEIQSCVRDKYLSLVEQYFNDDDEQEEDNE